jgi:hypothetical protein
LLLSSQYYKSPTQCLETVTQSHTQNSKEEKKEKSTFHTLPCSSCSRWLMIMAPCPKYRLSSQMVFENTLMANMKNIFFFWGIYLFMHKMKGILKFCLHIIMHEITVFVMLCIERKWIDLVNQGTQPIFFRTAIIMFVDTLQPAEF